MRKIYLDWCPRPTSSSQNRAYSQELSADEVNISLANNVTLKKVVWACRNDGLFVFAVDWIQGEFEGSSALRVAAAHQISHLLKEKSGHSHYYNKDMQGYDSENAFPSLSVDPIELELQSNISLPSLMKLVKDDKQILEIEVSSFKHKGENVNALLLLKNQYAKLFEKSKQAKQEVSKKTWYLYKFEFRAYSYKWPISVLIAICVLLAFFEVNGVVDPDSYIKHNIQFNFEVSKKTVPKFWNNLLLGLLPTSIGILVLEISIKRRKILRAFKRARGYLIYGNVLCSNIQNLIKHAQTDKDFRDCLNFEYAITLLEDLILIEEKKRNQTYFWLLTAVLMSYSKFYSVIIEFVPDLNEIVPILKIITSIMPYLPK